MHPRDQARPSGPPCGEIRPAPARLSTFEITAARRRGVLIFLRMVVSLHIATGDKENQPINVDGEIQPGGQQQKDGVRNLFHR